MKASLTSVVVGVVLLGLGAAVAPVVPGAGEGVGIDGLRSAARAASTPATPPAATPPIKRLDVTVVSIPTLVPGQQGLARVRVTNPVTGDVALRSITSTVRGLHPSCAGDLTTGPVVESGTVLTRRGTAGSSVVFTVPMRFADDPTAPQDCQGDAYTITFTATGSGK